MAVVAAHILTTVVDERGLRSETAGLGARNQFTAYAERTRVSQFDDEIVECSQQRAEFVRGNPSLFAD
jgi:hypothetical protein